MKLQAARACLFEGSSAHAWPSQLPYRLASLGLPLLLRETTRFFVFCPQLALRPRYFP